MTGGSESTVILGSFNDITALLLVRKQFTIVARVVRSGEFID
jgi:hypothetical protein